MNTFELIKSEVEESMGGKLLSITVIRRADFWSSDFEVMYRGKRLSSAGFKYLKKIDTCALIIFANTKVEFAMDFDRTKLENFILSGHWSINSEIYCDQVRELDFEAFFVLTEGKLLYFGQDDDELDIAIEKHIRKKHMIKECLAVNKNEDEPKKRRM